MLRRQPAAVVARKQPPVGNGEQRVVRLVVVGAREERLVGGDERQVEAVGKLHHRRLA